MKAISYALFGNPETRHHNCFDFYSYLRGLMINIRLNRLLFPEWENVVHISRGTHDLYGEFFYKLNNIKNVRVIICEDAPLCLSMLWRLKPVFEREENGDFKYTHVICRDIDSPTVYRDAQAVTYWISKDTAAHAINDSTGHGLVMCGGMVGFRPEYICEIIGCKTWDELINLSRNTIPGITFTVKSDDQTVLNKVIYPLVAMHGGWTFVHHNFRGLGHNPYDRNPLYMTCNCEPTAGHSPQCGNNVMLPIAEELKESNAIAGHIGAAGYYPPVLSKFINKYSEQFRDLKEIEKDYEDLFYWVKSGVI